MSENDPQTKHENKRSIVWYLLLVPVVIVLLFVLIKPSDDINEPTPPPGESEPALHGKWTGTIQDLEDVDRVFHLRLHEFQPAKQNQAILQSSGCIALETDSALAPVSAQAQSLSSGGYELTMYANVNIGEELRVLKFTGTMGSDVEPIAMEGNWLSSDGSGGWMATHENQEVSECPGIDQLPGVFLQAGFDQVQQYKTDEIFFQHQDFQLQTNIVSSGGVVTSPDGVRYSMEEFTDIFSPDVEYLTEFRYAHHIDGLPISGRPYTISLLDVLGNPIPGSEVTDVWSACTTGAPGNYRVELSKETEPDMLISWDAVPPSEGWNPSAGEGFYGLSVIDFPEIEGTFFGTETSVTHHTIPWEDFEDGSPGDPGGTNFGYSLSEFPDGTFAIDISVFTIPVHPQGAGSECHIWDLDQEVVFHKVGDQITFEGQ